MLISGYFGIKHLVRPLLKLAIDLIVYGIIAYLLGVMLLGINFSMKGLLYGIDIHNWFVINFAMLVLTAPIIEVAFEGMKERTFILLYFMARYVRLMKDNNSQLYLHFKRYGVHYWLLSSVILTVGMICLYKLGHLPQSVRYFGYNNPLILLSAFSVFILFSSLKIQSKYINIIATGMFGVFLMHTPPEIIPIRNAYSFQIFQTYGYLGIFAEVIILFMVLTLIAVPVEHINQRISQVIYGFIKK